MKFYYGNVTLKINTILSCSILFFSHHLFPYTSSHLHYLKEALNSPIKTLSQAADKIMLQMPHAHENSTTTQKLIVHLHTSSKTNQASKEWAEQCINECKNIIQNKQEHQKSRFFKKRDLLILLIALLSLSIAIYIAFKLPSIIQQIQNISQRILSTETTQRTEMHAILQNEQQVIEQLRNELSACLNQEISERQRLIEENRNQQIALASNFQEIRDQLSNYSRQESVENLSTELTQNINEQTGNLSSRIALIETQLAQTNNLLNQTIINEREHAQSLQIELRNLQQAYAARIDTCIAEYGRMINELNRYHQALRQRAPAEIQPMTTMQRLSGLFSRQTIQDVSYASYAINNAGYAISNTRNLATSIGNVFESPEQTTSTPQTSLLLSQLPTPPQTTPQHN